MNLTYTKVKFNWTFVEQKVFDTIKWVVIKYISLFYSNFNKRSGIHTDASDIQLG